MNNLLMNNYPTIHYFDQDIISLYEDVWKVTHAQWRKSKKGDAFPLSHLAHEGSDVVSFIDTVFSSFALVYSHRDDVSVSEMLNVFYEVQEENGAIRCLYDIKTGKPVYPRGNPDGLAPPLLVWAEHNYFNKTDNKRRLKLILPRLDAYLTWIQELSLHENGLFSVPIASTHMQNTPRKDVCYPIDFNAQMALAYNYMNVLASYVNNRNLIFKYAKAYYNLKSLINKHFWDPEDKMYYDLGSQCEFMRVKTLASYWTLLAKISNNVQVHSMVSYLKDPDYFYSENPFPTLAMNENLYAPQGMGFRGGVYPMFTYMVIKGLELYEKYEFARESALKHIYAIFDTWLATSKKNNGSGIFFEAYQADGKTHAQPSSKANPIRENYIATAAVSIVSLIIENVIGIHLSTPRKIVVWVISNLEAMGIESLKLNKNNISILIRKTERGDWSIFQNTEKLYYFSIKIHEMNLTKTIPIPSGKCSLMVAKL